MEEPWAGQSLHRKQRPGQWHQHQDQVHRSERGIARKHHRTPEQGQRRPPRQYLVGKKPTLVVGADEGDDRGESEQVEAPCHGPPEQVALAIAAVEEDAEADEGEDDCRLQERGIQLRAGAQSDWPNQRETRSRYPRLTLSRVPSVRMALNYHEHHGCSQLTLSTLQ